MILKTQFILYGVEPLKTFLGNVWEERIVAESWLCVPSANRQRRHAAWGVRWVFYLVTLFSQNSPEGQHKLLPCVLCLSEQQCYHFRLMLHVPFPSCHCQMELTQDNTVWLGLIFIGGVSPELEMDMDCCMAVGDKRRCFGKPETLGAVLGLAEIRLLVKGRGGI